jgi:hypothetical protein
MLRKYLVGIALALLLAAPAHSDELPAPVGDILLTVDGAITNTNAGNALQLDRSMLASLPQIVVRTTTDWTDGIGEFVGPSVRDVLALAGAEGSVVRAVALNDYAVDIPMEDFERFDVVLAMTMDGEQLSARDKGPIWIVYPRDDNPELDAPEVNARWIWQLVALTVR